jgi:hypothetical protein
VNWDAIGAIGDFASAIAVLATLIYLARQIRDSRVAQETTTDWMMTQAFNQIHVPIIENADVARILSVAQQGEVTDPTDQARLRSIVIAIMNSYAAVWRAFKAGHLSKSSYDELVADTRILFAPGVLPFVKEDLEIRDEAFVREFLPELVEERETRLTSIKQGSIGKPIAPQASGS